MPSYSFKCDTCNTYLERFLTIPEFIKSKENLIKCEGCDGGYLHHKIYSVGAEIEKSNDQIILDIQDEVAKTVNKISNGDHRAIEEIYGDRPNPYKNNGEVNDNY